jgi:hypothetical protein
MWNNVSVNVTINTLFIWFYATMQTNVSVKQIRLYAFYMAM